MITIYQNGQITEFLQRFENRRQEIPAEVRHSVAGILGKIRERGDEALIELTLEFDGADIRSAGLPVQESEIEKAVRSMPPGFMDILEESARNIRRFHEQDKARSWMDWRNGALLGQRVTPLDRVGIYVPGGRAAYPSSLLMATIPAQVAGVEEIVIVTPSDKNGRIHAAVLATARVTGTTTLFRVGGAQAVGALAFGTVTIPKVDKIVGPGNIYVAEAKRQVYGIVDIDMIAGPSEVAILADSQANPEFVAADLLAQAEHDPLASAICVTNEPKLAKAVQKAVIRQTGKLKRAETITASLKNWGAVLVTTDWDEAVDLTNRLAAEHLGLHVSRPWDVLPQIRHAGAIFLGHYAPETVGDYWAGPNHVLPTNQTARFASPLGTRDFQKVSNIIQYSQDALARDAQKIMTFANMEGLDGHAHAVRQRLGKRSE
jgi:histidinol dehydrogenase